jgi:hypothetical protein
MQINVIHNPFRTDRKVLLDSEAREHILSLRIWNSVHDELRPFRGINLAHKQIVRWARQEKLPMVCIAEDDFHLTAPGAWEYFIKNIPADFDLYLSGVYCGAVNKDNSVVDFCGLHLYIVHERFYSCYLGVDEMTNLDRGLAGRGRYIVSNPFCAIQHDGWSDNKQRYASYGHLLTNKKLCCENL